MKSRILMLVSLAIIPAVGRAVDITFGAAIDAGFANNTGIDLPTGSLVRIGTFNLTPSQISAAANNLTLLNSAWTQVATTVIGSGDPAAAGSNSNPANAGLFSGSVNSLNTSATGLNISGSTLYYWVFNATTMNAATQQGIFGSTTWTIPSGTGGLGDLALHTDLNFLTGAGSSLAGTALLPVGFFGPGTNLTGGGPDFRLAEISPIPEPAETAMIAALGACVLVFQRRRSLRQRGR